MNVRCGWDIIKGTVKGFSEHRVLRLSAAMAYYAIFSIGPLLVLIVGVAGLVMGEERVRHEVGQQLQGLVGPKSAQMVESMMAARHMGGSVMATIIGGVALLFGAAGVFGQLQDSLNTIWEVQAKPGQGLWGFIRDRFFSMSMVLGIGFLLLISMVLSAAVNGLAHSISRLISLPPWVAMAFNEVVSLLVITALFALVFKILPDVKIRWRDVWVGALGTALLFTLGKYVLGLYLGRESTTSAYGAGSAFVLILMYVYYSSLILFFGAEFTQAYARRLGAGIQPSEYAVRLTEPERAKQGVPSEPQVEAAARAQGRAGAPGAGKAGTARAPVRAPAAQPGLAPVYATHSLVPQPPHPEVWAGTQAYAVGAAPSPHEERAGERRARSPLVQGPQVTRLWPMVGVALGVGVAAGLFLRLRTFGRPLGFAR